MFSSSTRVVTDFPLPLGPEIKMDTRKERSFGKRKLIGLLLPLDVETPM